MSGGGGGGGGLFSDPLQTAVIIGASIAAPYAAPALFGAGAGLGTIALTGAGIGGLGSALIGRDPMMGALGGGLGGLGAGAAGLGAGAGATTGTTGGALGAGTVGTSGATLAGTGSTLASTPVAGSLYGGLSATPAAGTVGALSAAPAAGTFGSVAAPSSFGISSLAPSSTSFLAGTGAAGGAGAAGSGGILGSMGITPTMAGYGAGALGLMSLAGKERKQYGQPTTEEVTYKGGPLQYFKYDPRTYQADVPVPPNPPYRAQYVAGGGHIKSYADGGDVAAQNVAEGALQSAVTQPVAPPPPDPFVSQIVERMRMPSLMPAIQNLQQGFNTQPMQPPMPQPQAAPQAAPVQAMANYAAPQTPTVTPTQFNPQFIPGSPAHQAEQARIEAEARAKQEAEDAASNRFSIANDGSLGSPGGYAGGLMPRDLKYARGGIAGLNAFAAGGRGHLGSYSDGARVLKGPGDGMSDSIPATIEGKQPARLADSEFVIPADVVSHLGNGSSDAGAKKLYSMMDRVRKARTGKVKQASRINPNKYLPA